MAISNTGILFGSTVLFRQISILRYLHIIWDLAEEKSAKFVKIQLVIMMKISRKSRFQDGGKV